MKMKGEPNKEKKEGELYEEWQKCDKLKYLPVLHTQETEESKLHLCSRIPRFLGHVFTKPLLDKNTNRCRDKRHD